MRGGTQLEGGGNELGASQLRDVDRPAQSLAGAPLLHEAWRAASMQALVSRKLRASPVVPISILFMT